MMTRITRNHAEIDDLKMINNSYGNAVGDDTLREFAKFLADETKTSDTIAQDGGDEFVIILPHRHIDSAATALAKRIEHWNAQCPTELYSARGAS